MPFKIYIYPDGGSKEHSIRTGRFNGNAVRVLVISQLWLGVLQIGRFVPESAKLAFEKIPDGSEWMLKKTTDLNAFARDFENFSNSRIFLDPFFEHYEQELVDCKKDNPRRT